MRKTHHIADRRITAHGICLLAVSIFAIIALFFAPSFTSCWAYADDSESSSSTQSSSNKAAEDDDFMPMTDGGNAEKYLKDIKGDEAVEDAKESVEQAQADALGHWVYEDVETTSQREEQAAPQDPGTAIAVAATALSGYGRTGGIVGPTSGTANKKRHTRPPDVGRNGDWTVYNRVMAAIPNHAVGNLYTDCSATVALAVWWSGVDDGFTGANTVAQARYMAGSSKWDRVGGKNAYFHRRSGTCDGFTLKPGDVLVGKPCVTEGRRTHIFIYTGTDISNLKYPGADYTIFESHMAKSWPGMQQFTPIPNGTVDYAVYRRNTNGLDIDGSRFSGIYLDEKIRYSPETKVVSEKNSERLAVRYVYEEYQVNYGGLPLGSSVASPSTFRYDTDTFALANPILPSGYVFDGWFTGRYLGTKVAEVSKGTASDVDIFAHIHEDSIHTLAYHQDLEIPQKDGIWVPFLKKTFSAAELAVLIAVAVAVLAGVAFALKRQKANN